VKVSLHKSPDVVFLSWWIYELPEVEPPDPGSHGKAAAKQKK